MGSFSSSYVTFGQYNIQKFGNIVVFCAMITLHNIEDWKTVGNIKSGYRPKTTVYTNITDAWSNCTICMIITTGDIQIYGNKKLNDNSTMNAVWITD